MVNKMLVAAALASVSVTGVAFAQAAGKVAVVSVQGAIVGTKDGQKAAAELEAKFAPKRKDIETRQNELTQLEDQMRKGGNLLADEKRNQLTRDIDEKRKRLNRDIQDAQEEVDQEQQRALNGLLQRTLAVIEKYSKDNGYTMVLDVSNPNTPVLYASSGIDITQDIVALYDKTSANGGPSVPTGSTAPAPGQPSGLGVSPTRPAPPAAH